MDFWGDDNPGWWVTAIATVLSLVGALMVWSASMPWWWFGAGFIAAGGVLIWQEIRRALAGESGLREIWESFSEPKRIGGEFYGVTVVPSTLAAEFAVCVVIAAVVVVMAPELLMGDRPVSYDHPVHFMKAWRLENEFLWTGRVRGWSHAWLGGFPAQYLYPWGADMLVVGVHALTLGFASLSTSYAWALAIFWAFRGWALYRFASIGAGRWAGLLAAVLWMTDTAAARMGGWNYAMAVGVWPMSLAVALGVWATYWLSRVATDDRPRNIAGLAIAMGLALMSHPYAVFHLAVAGPVAVACAWFAKDVVSWTAATGRMILGYIAGIALGFSWLLPFVALGGEMDSNFGGRWRPLYEIGVSLYNSATFPGTWGWIIAMGAVGVVICLVARRFHQMFTGWLAAGLLIFASTDFLAAFHLLEYSDGLQGLHYKRFIQLLKPYWIAAAAVLVVGAYRMWAGRSTSETSDETSRDSAGSGRITVALGALVVVAALAPIVVGFSEKFSSKHLARDLQVESERPHRRARRDLAAWFEQKHPEGPFEGGEFFRVAYCCGYHDHSFVDFGARIDFPLYKIGYTPATSFEHRVKSGDREILDALNVRYVFSAGPSNRPYFKPIEQFGQLYLYEVKDWNRQPFEIVVGDGKAQQDVGAGESGDGASLVEFGRERIVIDVPESAVPDAGGRLRVNVSNFSRWEAWRNGEWLSIEETTLKQDAKTGFMTVPLEAGRYVFEFETSWLDWLAWLFGMFGLAVVVLLWLAGRESGRFAVWWRAGTEWLSDLRQTYLWGDGALFAALVAVTLVVASGLAWWSPAIEVEHIPLPSKKVSSVEFDAAASISDAQVGIRRGGDFDRCRQLFGRFLCGSAMWKQPHTKVEDFGFKYDRYRCIWSHPLPGGPTEFVFRDVPVAEGMIGFFGVAESGSRPTGSPVNVTVGVDGIERYSSKTKQDEALHGFELPLTKWADGSEADITFKVNAKNTGVRHLCFNAQTVTVEGDPIEETQTFVPDVPRASGLRP